MPRGRSANKADNAVRAIIEDIRGRRGLQQEWDSIDLDVRKEIVSKWAKLITLSMNLKDSEEPAMLATCTEDPSYGKSAE